MRYTSNYGRNMQQKERIRSYIGFVIKAGKAVYGMDNVMKKRCYTVLIDTGLGENSMNKLKQYLVKTNTEFFMLDNLSDYTNREGCKVFGIREEHLADAIKVVIKGEN